MLLIANAITYFYLYLPNLEDLVSINKNNNIKKTYRLELHLILQCKATLWCQSTWNQEIFYVKGIINHK